MSDLRSIQLTGRQFDRLESILTHENRWTHIWIAPNECENKNQMSESESYFVQNIIIFYFTSTGIYGYLNGVRLYAPGEECLPQGGVCAKRKDCNQTENSLPKGLCPDKNIGVECCSAGNASFHTNLTMPEIISTFRM